MRATGFSFSESGPESVIKQVESYFSEEENRMMYGITPKKQHMKNDIRSSLSKTYKSPLNKASKDILTNEKLNNDSKAQIEFLMNKVEQAHSKISELQDQMNSIIDQSDLESKEKKYSSTQNVPKLLQQTFDSNSIDEIDSIRESENRLPQFRSSSPTPKDDCYLDVPIPRMDPDYVPKEIMYQYMSEIDKLRKDNSKLKETILKRTEEANATIMKLAQLKKQAEEQNKSNMQNLSDGIEKDKLLKEQTLFYKFNCLHSDS